MSSNPRCVYCARLRDSGFVAKSAEAVAFHDVYLVSPGYTLLVPCRHEADYFALDPDERSALWALVDELCEHLDERFELDGYNIGINTGRAAGHYDPHAYVHV